MMAEEHFSVAAFFIDYKNRAYQVLSSIQMVHLIEGITNVGTTEQNWY